MSQRADSGGRRVCTSAIALLLMVTACTHEPSSCEQRARAVASWQRLKNTAVLTIEGNSNASPIAPWVAAYEALRTDVEGMMEGAPQAVDDEVANAQTAIDELNALLASNDADSRENRPRLSVLISLFHRSLASLFRSMDAACATSANTSSTTLS
jgi:hypothetical protein